MIKFSRWSVGIACSRDRGSESQLHFRRRHHHLPPPQDARFSWRDHHSSNGHHAAPNAQRCLHPGSSTRATQGASTAGRSGLQVHIPIAAQNAERRNINSNAIIPRWPGVSCTNSSMHRRCSALSLHSRGSSASAGLTHFRLDAKNCRERGCWQLATRRRYGFIPVPVFARWAWMCGDTITRSARAIGSGAPAITESMPCAARGS